MNSEHALVVTSIAAPTQAMQELAAGCREHGAAVFVIGDSKSPAQYTLAGAQFFSLQQQRDSGLQFARLCPERRYARKNIGYLLAMRGGAKVIVETDDDNLPLAGFWEPRRRLQRAAELANRGWVNVYRYFTDADCWPRGLPLDAFRQPVPALESLTVRELDCPIQQGLANEDPDVDAIFRLLFPLPLSFRDGEKVALSEGAWCPFNSQNTTWWADAFPLLYLPSYCSMRMTDIWRGFVAQRLAWLLGWSVLFHSPTVYQLRNEHNLMRDFSDEVSGYLNNRRIGEALDALPLKAGAGQMGDNLRLCYEALVRMELIDKLELPLLDAWLSDLSQLGSE